MKLFYQFLFWHDMNIFLQKPYQLVRNTFIFLCISLSLASQSYAVTGAADTSANTKILIVGDSLSSEYGIERHTGWVQLLRAKLAEQNVNAQVINASISGDTTSGGLTRLPALLKAHQPNIVLIELGGNDALRGLSLTVSEMNLTNMIKLSQAAGAKVVLAGMQIPPNYGVQYTTHFKKMYETISINTRAALIPFFLAGLETRSDLFISDNIHPNEAAQEIILNNVWPTLSQVINRS
jgi:acyl-CoA thioesterase-1